MGAEKQVKRSTPAVVSWVRNRKLRLGRGVEAVQRKELAN